MNDSWISEYYEISVTVSPIWCPDAMVVEFVNAMFALRAGDVSALDKAPDNAISLERWVMDQRCWAAEVTKIRLLSGYCLLSQMRQSQLKES